MDSVNKKSYFTEPQLQRYISDELKKLGNRNSWNREV